MASVKAVLRKNQKNDGTYPLVIRITKDRKTSFIYLNHSVLLSDWDQKAQRVKKSYSQCKALNDLITQKLSEAHRTLLELETFNEDGSSESIRDAALSTNKNTSFFGQAKIYIDLLEQSGKFNRKSAEEPRINRFKEFLKNKDIYFSEITVSLLKQFKAYLKATRNISERTIINHLVVIRSIYSQAAEAGMASKKNYPFGKGKIQIKFPDSKKIGLSSEEVKALEEIELTKHENHARNLWLFSFYFAGMRASDVLRVKWSDFQNGRFYYSMGKNQKADSLKVSGKVQKILDQYSCDTNHNLVFPDLESLPTLSDNFVVQRRIKTRIKSSDEFLSRISNKIGLSKSLTMHIARHTFGNISGDKIHVQMLQKLYRHSDIKTTIGYQANFIHKTADDALDAVIGN